MDIHMAAIAFTNVQANETSDGKIGLLQHGKHTAKSDSFQRKASACECENTWERV